MDKKEYYLWDTRDIVGNCILLWRKGGGYTCNLEDAELFSEKEAKAQHGCRKSDVPYHKDVLEGISHRHVDLQDLNKIVILKDKI